MIIAYGQNRSDRDFAHVTYDKLFIDAAGSRDEWDALAYKGGLVDGDTLVVVSEHDLGRGRRLVSVKSGLASLGVTLRVEALPVAPHRPDKITKHWRPSPDDLAYVRGLWRNRLLSRAYVQRKAQERCGQWLTVNQLNRACGPRTVTEPKIDV